MDLSDKITAAVLIIFELIILFVLQDFFFEKMNIFKFVFLGVMAIVQVYVLTSGEF